MLHWTNTDKKTRFAHNTMNNILHFAEKIRDKCNLGPMLYLYLFKNKTKTKTHASWECST